MNSSCFATYCKCLLIQRLDEIKSSRNDHICSTFKEKPFYSVTMEEGGTCPAAPAQFRRAPTFSISPIAFYYMIPPWDPRRITHWVPFWYRRGYFFYMSNSALIFWVHFYTSKGLLLWGSSSLPSAPRDPIELPTVFLFGTAGGIFFYMSSSTLIFWIHFYTCKGFLL